MPTKYQAFENQRKFAKQRNIDFHFTFENWCEWWEQQLGANWMKLRGRRRDKYCMARKGDVGPYCINNVLCITLSENTRQRNRYKPTRGENNAQAKVSPSDVLFIRDSILTVKELMKIFPIQERAIYSIKERRSWKHLK